jgi:N-acetylglucosaminyl-diphospho-decaprenol L-rhamnosyltransferase
MRLPQVADGSMLGAGCHHWPQVAWSAAITGTQASGSVATVRKPGSWRHCGNGDTARAIVGIAFRVSFAHVAKVSTPELPLLSIVIVAYRSRDEIGQCLQSLPPSLDGRPVEVIVVDNSAGDGTADLVRGAFSHVHYVAAPQNLGFGRANNRGYALARGEFVLFLNPDTVSNAPALTHCLRRLDDDPRIGLISPRLVQANGAMDLACRRSIPTPWDGFCRATGLAARYPQRRLFAGYNLTHLPVGGTYDVGAINGAFMLAPRRVLAAVAPDGAVFDERFFMYGDDLDLCIRVARAGWRVVYDGAVSIVHLKGTSVAKEYGTMSRAIFDANRDVYLKHFAPSAVARVKYRVAFGAWKWFALVRARLQRHRQVRPL